MDFVSQFGVEEWREISAVIKQWLQTSSSFIALPLLFSMTTAATDDNESKRANDKIDKFIFNMDRQHRMFSFGGFQALSFFYRLELALLKQEYSHLRDFCRYISAKCRK